MNEEDLVYRLRKRAEIRRQIPTRKSVQEGASDRIADLLDEAALEIEHLKCEIESLKEELSEYIFYAS
jgi:phage host-nuclease inhibitor protein Gam